MWKVPVDGGAEVKVSDFNRGYGLQFTLTTTGAYFIDTLDTTTLKFFDFRTHSVRVVTKLPGPIADGLVVSPDGQWLLYGKSDAAGSQLMLVDNFQ
ncbi:MAG: hypothetical protein M3Y57_19985 [Acidobacteriota bacterium]|nr:hypothetical protein [Acidobacteriota bacterium]